MAELVPASFRDLVIRLYKEPEIQDSIFDLPRRSWYLPAEDAPDMSVAFHGKRAGNPVGPASGPHTQMAQNLVLSYLAGSRIMELKTVQINDRLDIPRPCIDMTNVGYNVEWSQELLVEQSLREYVAGLMLVTMLQKHHPLKEHFGDASGDVIFDISLGYDLEGIKSAKVQNYLDGIRDCSKLVNQLRSEIPSKIAGAAEVPFPTQVANTLTLSTFHGCPTDEIERICEFLIAERELDVIVKMNPPTIGQEEMEHLLHDVMGYKDIHVRPSAYTGSQTFDEAVEMCQRLRGFAAQRGRNFGCKFSNTLEVDNHRDFFSPDNEAMYLSGLPLHVITMTLTDRFRQAVGPEVPISFSAGIDAANFADTVACGFVPITTCSDLLKPGGYGRLPAYLKNLAKAMNSVEATNIGEFLLRIYNNGEKASDLAAEKGGSVDAWAGWLNTSQVARTVQENPRYGAEKNSRVPKRIDSTLEILDCITCNKCIPVCPNDANFSYPTEPVKFDVCDYIVSPDGSYKKDTPHKFFIEKKNQIANFGEFCNECGNCDTFCPEYGGPYIEKPTFYMSIESLKEAGDRDGFVVGDDDSGPWILGQINNIKYRLTIKADGGLYTWSDDVLEADFDATEFNLVEVRLKNNLSESHRIEMNLFHSLRIMRQGIVDQSAMNQVNASLLV